MRAQEKKADTGTSNQQGEHDLQLPTGGQVSNKCACVCADLHVSGASIDSLANILHSTFSALNHIYNVAGLASETCSCRVRSSCAMTFETVRVHDVRARFAAPAPTGGLARAGE